MILALALALAVGQFPQAGNPAISNPPAPAAFPDGGGTINGPLIVNGSVTAIGFNMVSGCFSLPGGACIGDQTGLAGGNITLNTVDGGSVYVGDGGTGTAYVGTMNLQNFMEINAGGAIPSTTGDNGYLWIDGAGNFLQFSGHYGVFFNSNDGTALFNCNELGGDCFYFLNLVLNENLELLSNGAIELDPYTSAGGVLATQGSSIQHPAGNLNTNVVIGDGGSLWVSGPIVGDAGITIGSGSGITASGSTCTLQWYGSPTYLVTLTGCQLNVTSLVPSNLATDLISDPGSGVAVIYMTGGDYQTVNIPGNFIADAGTFVNGVVASQVVTPLLDAGIVCVGGNDDCASRSGQNHLQNIPDGGALLVSVSEGSNYVQLWDYDGGQVASLDNDGDLVVLGSIQATTLFSNIEGYNIEAANFVEAVGFVQGATGLFDDTVNVAGIHVNGNTQNITAPDGGYFKWIAGSHTAAPWIAQWYPTNNVSQNPVGGIDQFGNLIPDGGLLLQGHFDTTGVGTVATSPGAILTGCWDGGVTLAAGSSDTAGTITVSTGLHTCALATNSAGDTLQVTFGTPYDAGYAVVITPNSGASSGIALPSAGVVKSGSNFQITSFSSSFTPVTSTSYSWDYVTIGLGPNAH